MNFAELVFIAIICFTAGGALLAVLARSIIHAMLGLVATMFGIAGLYIYLNAPFIAMMQILIYVGAVTILIAFAIMLAGPMAKRPREWTTGAKFAGALGVSVVSMFIIYFFIRPDIFYILNPLYRLGSFLYAKIFYYVLVCYPKTHKHFIYFCIN
ncbi:MAG: NADH-quinone oxidoreductase subunit J, partial [Smithellaceae bacterium]|nr:NADH-quinone oxidoreductase subunit J [Smithellaceae bacterium]